MMITLAGSFTLGFGEPGNYLLLVAILGAQKICYSLTSHGLNIKYIKNHHHASDYAQDSSSLGPPLPSVFVIANPAYLQTL